MDTKTTPPVDAVEDDSDALEKPDASTVDATPAAGGAPVASIKPAKKGLKQKLAAFNLYLLLFVFIMLIAGVVIFITYLQAKKQETTSVISSQKLDTAALKQLANSDATVGDPKQLLSVQSNAVFAGKVLVKDTLEVAGGIQVNGPVALSGLSVSGQTNLTETQVGRNLTVAGDIAVQGGLTLQKSLQVNGGGSFSGPLSAPQITVTGIQINSDLVLTHHIAAGGPSPSRSNGTALGSGGTASVNGSDTAGSITINTGSGPPAGCFTNIIFAQKYNTVPHVIVTPIGSDAGGLDYYVTKTTSGFSICDKSAPPSGASFGFDYFVVY